MIGDKNQKSAPGDRIKSALLLAPEETGEETGEEILFAATLVMSIDPISKNIVTSALSSCEVDSQKFDFNPEQMHTMVLLFAADLKASRSMKLIAEILSQSGVTYES